MFTVFVKDIIYTLILVGFLIWFDPAMGVFFLRHDLWVIDNAS